MKKGTILKRGITLLLSVALTLTIAPVVSNDTTAQAASATDQGEVTAYAAKESLLNDYAAKKKNDWLVFGKDENGQALSWYILGKDSGVSGDNIALIAANDIKKKQAFQSDTTNNQTYSYPAGTGYGDSAGTIEVYPNHYGASELRKALQSMAKDTAYFSTGEQSLMQETTIPNRDIKNGKTYDTSDVLYVPMGVTTNGNKDQTVYVESGNSRAFDRYDRAGSYIYWLRYPSDGNRMCTLAIASSSTRDSVSVSAWINTEMLPVRPATNLDVSDVLFASAAQAATTDQVNTGKMFEYCTDEMAMKDTDFMNTYGRKPWVSRAMTLRMDGRNRKIGSVSYENETGMIHAQKDPAATGTVSLVVQGNENGLDWFYSKKIEGTEELQTAELKNVLLKELNTRRNSIFNLVLDTIDLSKCKIWLETTGEDGLAYAVNATEQPMLKMYYNEGASPKKVFAPYDPALTVRGLKEEVAKRTGIDTSVQQLVYRSQILAERDADGKELRLQDYNIQKGDTLSLNQSVSEADVTIVLPKGEQTLSTKAVCTSTGILGAALYWTDTKDQPVSGKAHYYPWCYKAHLTLTAMPGYYLTADTGVKINGEDVAQTSLGSDGSLTFAKQYESTTLKLLGIVAPQPVTGVASGTEMTAEALGLPKEVTIETDSAAYTTAGVIWDLDHLVDGSYDPSLLTEQHFTVKGSVNLPEEVMNTDGIATEVTLDVTVQAAGVTGAVQSDPAAGTYAQSQQISLRSSTADAAIYYTTDGTVPEVMDGKPSGSTLLYTAPIRLDGVAGENINTTIQAIAVKDGMQDSVISSFTYTISIPAVRYTILASAGAHGTISPDGVTEVAEGESQTFVITPEEGYEIKTLRIDGAEEAVTGQYTFSDVRADHTIEAVFGRKEAPAPTPKPEPQPDPEPEPEPQPDPDPVTYKILEGADSLWVLNSDGSLTIRGEGELSKFVEIRLDGTVVDKKNYTVTEGSTIITLKADYLKTLSLGKHFLEMIWSDGSAGTTLTVTETAYDGNDKKKDSSEDDNNSRKNDGISDGTGNAGNGAASDKQDNNTGTVSQAATIRTGDASPVYLLITLLCASGIFLIGARHRSKEK